LRPVAGHAAAGDHDGDAIWMRFMRESFTSPRKTYAV
jgi:hypothetical protein